MTTEYLCLAIMTGLFLVAWLPVSIGKVSKYGLGWAGSNRETAPSVSLPSWVGRCERAHNNLKDNFPAFIAAILLLGLTSKFSEGTATAAMIYVGGRILHYVSYGMGISLLRTLGFAMGLFSNAYLLIQLCR